MNTNLQNKLKELGIGTVSYLRLMILANFLEEKNIDIETVDKKQIETFMLTM